MAKFLQKQNNLFEEVLLTDGLALIANSTLIGQIIDKVSLNKLFSYNIRKLKIEDIVTIEIFKKIGIKSLINDSTVYYIGDIQKLIELKSD